MLKLGKRLTFVAEEIGKVDSFADIGTDHGKLIIYALRNNFAKRAFAVDISEGSLAKAKQLIESSDLSDRVSFKCGDGLTLLDEVPDVIVIAGMGGNEIVKIMTETPMPTKYVLMPHQDAPVVRKYLVDNGFALLKDYYIFDGKYYPLIVAVPGESRYSISEIVLGANNPETEEYGERIAKRKEEIDALVRKNNTNISALTPEIRQEYEECMLWLRSQK